MKFNFDFNQLLTVTFTLFAVIDIIGSIPLLHALKKKAFLMALRDPACDGLPREPHHETLAYKIMPGGWPFEIIYLISPSFLPADGPGYRKRLVL